MNSTDTADHMTDEERERVAGLRDAAGKLRTAADAPARRRARRWDRPRSARGPRRRGEPVMPNTSLRPGAPPTRSP